MKNFRLLCTFALAFCALLAYILLNISKINSDFYKLANVEIGSAQKQEIARINEASNRAFIVACKDEEKFERVMAKMDESEIFSEILYEISDLSAYQNEMKAYLIALLDDESAGLILHDESEFFARSAREVFSKLRPLSLKDDFFSLSLHSRLQNESAVRFDASQNRFIAEIDGVAHYFASASFRADASDEEILKLTNFAISQGALVFSPRIFSAQGKSAGVRESSIAGGISLALCATLLLIAFGNARIFALLLVAFFGLACGCAAVIALCGSLHILSAVISTSLIGLMLDFSVHWLGEQSAKPICATSIKNMRAILLLGFAITAGGYFVFLFSPFFLLKEIAIFAIFALFGAFLFTYFALGALLENAKFRQAKFFAKFLNAQENFARKVPFNAGILLACVAIFGVFLYLKTSFKDDVGEYSSVDKNLSEMSAKLANLGSFGYDMILGHSANEVAKKLQENGLITSFVGAQILDENMQNQIKEKFASADRSAFGKLGLSENIINENFDKFSNFAMISDANASQSAFFARMPSLGREMVILRGVKNADEISRLAQSNGATYLNMKTAISRAFADIKVNALYLKLIAYALAFLLLWRFFSLARACVITLGVFCTNLATLAILTAFGVSINIFVIFALILAGAVGIDYMIFANNDKMALKAKIFGINLASLTSIISFFALSFSSTRAVALFGLSVSINIALVAILAVIYASKTKFDIITKFQKG